MERRRDQDGSTQPAGRTFDPRPHLRRIRGRGQEEESDYLDVKWRLAWLRTEHPDARIITEHVSLSDDSAIFRATVELPTGGCATGYGSENARDFPEYIEKAETKAIGRALAALGYGTQFALDFDLEGATAASGATHLADAPVERPAPRPEPTPAPQPTPSRPEPEPAAATAEPAEPAAPAPRRRSRERPAPTARETAPAEGFDRANYSWNDFWPWARSKGYGNASAVNELLGIDNITAHTPREAREMLEAYLREHESES